MLERRERLLTSWVWILAMYMFNCTRDSQIIHNQYQYQAKNKAVTIRRFVTTITKILRLLLGLLNVQTGASLLCRPEI